MQTIPEAIAKIEPEPADTFSPTRYPWTYACDFLRQHLEIVPAEVWTDPAISSLELIAPIPRSVASRVRQTWARLTGVDDLDAAVWLADAALVHDGVAVPAGVRDEILANLTRPA